MNKALGRAMKCRPIWLRQMAAPVVSCSVKLGDRQSNNNMAPTNITSKCSACGKCKKSTPGIRLHLLPRDARRRHEWLLALGIAYERSSQVVCSDHFDAAYQGSKGRLLSTAIPRPFNASEEHPHRETHTVNTERPTAVSAPASDVVTLEYECPGTTTTHDSIDEAISSEVLPCDIYDYDTATFGVLSGTMTVEEQLIMFTESNNNEAPRFVSCEDRVEESNKCGNLTMDSDIGGKVKEEPDEPTENQSFLGLHPASSQQLSLDLWTNTDEFDFVSVKEELMEDMTETTTFLMKDTRKEDAVAQPNCMPVKLEPIEDEETISITAVCTKSNTPIQNKRVEDKSEKYPLQDSTNIKQEAETSVPPSSNHHCSSFLLDEEAAYLRKKLKLELEHQELIEEHQRNRNSHGKIEQSAILETMQIQQAAERAKLAAEAEKNKYELLLQRQKQKSLL